MLFIDNNDSVICNRLPSPSSKLMAILSLTMPEVVLDEASLMTE